MEQYPNRNIWDRALRRIEARVNAHSFKTWFQPTHLVSEDAASLRVRVPNSWFAEWLRTNYLPVIQEALDEVERPGVSVEFVHDPGSKASPSTGNGPSTPPPRRAPRAAIGTPQPVVSSDELAGWLNPRYTFEKFVVSSCNQFAHAAANAVAEQPSRAYNPLYVYGGVGLGKTHLMQAIGNRLTQRGTARMRYLSTEQFMNELINAIRFERTHEFKEKHRNVDLLLIDDIQFLAGKERTQEEFFHTFNALYDAQKQIVITSDCPPREIPTLEDRLRSRFEWGLIADIQPPDLETKIAILRKKAEAEGANLPDDVALFIATNSKSNIRELEGALIRVVAYASVSGRELTLDYAKETLKDLLVPESAAVTVESIQKLVANHYNLRVAELKSKNNSQQIAFPRQIAMYLCKHMTECSLPEIGKRFGGKHHSTVIHAIQKIEHKRTREKDFDRLVDSFVQLLH
ncbi:MAG TPA: chromosomal replication initiator protein DnaA [Candidatus Polarisedimenticolaceae bacterium]|nr:chromosomal replication initiator protein DnaA [Candidatus Polarisedimenticolaceae bacterium]